MRVRAMLISQVFAAVDLLTRFVVPLMPDELHPGLLACEALKNLRDAPSGPYFARAVLASQWRASLLERYALQLSRAQLRAFLENRVLYDGASFAQSVFNGARPVILASPHYGSPPIAFLAAAHRMRGSRVLNLFYDSAQHCPRVPLLFERGGVEAHTLLDGFAGTVSAMRALNRNEYLAMMPDAFGDLEHTLVVPFFGRMLRVAAGTAFFALRTGASVVPVFAAPARRVGLRVTLGRPIDPRRFAEGDETQALFMLTRALFASFEREIRRSPEHWHHWETFPRVSTAVEPPGRLEDDAPLRLLRDKCDASPHLLQDIPELDLLVR
ncbi:MAG: lysophospholipid acyltransferase family protein [Gammaproteobacteria bacterium]